MSINVAIEYCGNKANNKIIIIIKHIGMHI